MTMVTTDGGIVLKMLMRGGVGSVMPFSQTGLLARRPWARLQAGKGLSTADALCTVASSITILGQSFCARDQILFAPFFALEHEVWAVM